MANRIIVPEIPLSELTLRRHVGLQHGQTVDRGTGNLVDKVVEVPLAQSEIMLGNWRMGYVGDAAGCAIALIHGHWSESERAEIKAAVDAIRGNAAAFIAQPPDITEDVGNDDDTDEYEPEEEDE